MEIRGNAQANSPSSSSDAFRALFERAPDPMLLANDDRCYVDANPAACALLGLDHFEIVGRRVDDFTPEEGRSFVADAWSTFVKVGQASGEYLLQTRHGSRQVEFNAVADVMPGLHLSILRDITARKQLETERQLFTDVVSSILTGLYLFELEDPEDPAGMRLIHANPASMDATGLSPDEIIGRTLREVFPPLAETEIPAIYAEVALGGVARELGHVVYGDDRIAESVFSLRAFPLPHRCVGVSFNDVSGARRSEARSIENLESMSDAFFTLDGDWKFTYLNPKGESLLHRPQEELLGRTIWEEFPRVEGAMYDVEFKRAVRNQVVVEFEEHYPPLGGWFAVRAYPTPDGLAVYYQDITARRDLEAQLLHALKLESVGELAGGIAHDFNNLLTVIDGYTALAQVKLDADTPFVQNALGEIAAASARASDLTGKLLAFSRKQMLQTRVADANHIVSSALDLVGPLLGAQVHVHRLLAPDVGNVLVDVGQIEQVIINLAINARDAMTEGGNLYVATKQVILDTPPAPELDLGAYVCITVRDDGCGMNEETQKKIFDPFFTTKPVDRGTGLGLSTAYGTISQSGGTISVASEPGEGTTFTIHLPACNSPISALPTHSIPSQPVGGAERILVVEDEPLVRHLVIEILESLGYHVRAAQNPREARALCAAETFDVMVTDVVMPGTDGPTLARTVVELQPDIRVLYTSGYTPKSSSNLDLEGTLTAFLTKPFSAAELAANVRGLLDLLDESPFVVTSEL